MGKKKSAYITPNGVYVEYRDCKNSYKPAKKDFDTYEEAWDWIVETFDNPTKDSIGIY